MSLYSEAVGFRTARKVALTVGVTVAAGSLLVRVLLLLRSGTSLESGDWVEPLLLGAIGVFAAFLAVRYHRRALEKSEGRFQRFAQNAPDVVFRFGVRPRVRLEYANDAFERITGYPAVELYRGGSDVTQLIHHEDREAVVSLLRSPPAVAFDVLPFRVVTPEGTAVWVESRCVPVLDAGGKIVAVEGIARDLTDRRRAEEEERHLQRVILQASDDWRRTFDAMPSAVVVLDGEGRIHRLNEAGVAALGSTYDDAIGRTLPEISDHEPWRTAIRLAAEPSRSTRERVYDEESGRWWEVVVTGVPAGAENDARTIITADEVTGLVKLETSIERSEKMAAMGALTAGVAHEVRNPLFAISASVDALGAMLTDRPKVAHLLDLMREQVARMNSLMHELLVFGRPASKEGVGEVSLGSVVQDSLGSCTPLADAAGVALVLEGAALRQVLRGDASRLGEVFTNLLQNAVQHSRRGGVVTLSVEDLQTEGGPWVRLRVTDAGSGFRKEDMEKIFEPFFSRRPGGTGLGLSIVLRVVEQHRGRVNLGNRPEGGASVSVELPCA
jgi:PAS domain S-box-containing protein